MDDTTMRAKFRVQEVRPLTWSTSSSEPGKKYSEQVYLSPVYSPNPEDENHAFWKATPNGYVQLFIDNPQAWGKLTVGQEFYLDFIPVSDPNAA